MFVSDNLMYTNNSIQTGTSINNADSGGINKMQDDAKSANYSQQVNSSVQINLIIDGLEPCNDYIYLWNKTYKENDFLCAKHTGWSGKTIIIKEQTSSLAKTACNIITGDKSEKIIEEYNKNNELTKKTYYKKDGTCEISKYNKDGSIEKKVVIKNTDNQDLGYKSELKKTYYSKDGSYRELEETYEMKQNYKDAVCTESNITYYDKDGNVDILSTTINAAFMNVVEGLINS